MTGLRGEEAGAERLRATALRDFGVPVPLEDRTGKTYVLALKPGDMPVPHLIRYALSLIGLAAAGPGEKVAWWVDFTYKGEPCEVAHQKFGVRIYLTSERPEADVQKTLGEVKQKLSAAMRTVEAGSPTLSPIWTGPRRCFQRRCTILRTNFCDVRVGWWCGREDRSDMPATPAIRYRSAHRFAVSHDTS